MQVDVERVIDRAIRNMAFQYLRQAIIKSDHFRFAHQFIIIDELLKQLVAFFPAKLIETERNSADELQYLDDQINELSANQKDPKTQTISIGGDKIAQLTSQDPSNTYESALSHYENFLRCFVDLYSIQVMEYDYQRTPKTYRERELAEQVEESSMSFSTERSVSFFIFFKAKVWFLKIYIENCRNSKIGGFWIFSLQINSEKILNPECQKVQNPEFRIKKLEKQIPKKFKIRILENNSEY